MLKEQTPGWREKGEPDPHAGKYDGEVSELTLGYYTDDQLANAVFLHDHRSLDLNAALRGEPTSITLLTAAKERIRWLSRKYHNLLQAVTHGASTDLAERLVSQLLASGAKNYQENHYDLTIDGETPIKAVVTLMKQGAKSPHELRLEAEQFADRMADLLRQAKDKTHWKVLNPRIDTLLREWEAHSASQD